MSDFPMPLYRPLVDPVSKASNFNRSAGIYGQLSIDCFNACIDPEKEVSADTLRGMEKRCMDGCLTVSLQNFTIYGTQYTQRSEIEPWLETDKVNLS